MYFVIHTFFVCIYVSICDPESSRGCFFFFFFVIDMAGVVAPRNSLEVEKTSDMELPVSLSSSSSVKNPQSLRIQVLLIIYVITNASCFCLAVADDYIIQK